MPNKVAEIQGTKVIGDNVPTETVNELVKVTSELIRSVLDKDWGLYVSLCDETLTAYEPEAHTQLVEGLRFHEFYFTLPQKNPAPLYNTTLFNFTVRVMGETAIVTYLRMNQSNSSGSPSTSQAMETRIWKRSQKNVFGWVLVHFHRNGANSAS